MNTDPPLLKPSEALTRLQPDSIEDNNSEVKSSVFEQIRYGFKLGAIGLLTPPGMVCEVMQMQQIFPVPNAPAWLSGLINLRGNLVPVVNLSGLLGIEDNDETKNTLHSELNMLVIGSDVKAVAVIIKGLPQPVSTERHESELPPIADMAKQFVINAYSYRQRIWIDIDLEPYLMSLSKPLAA